MIVAENETPDTAATVIEGECQNELGINVNLVSGFGQFHTDRDRVIDGHECHGKPYTTISLAAIIEMARNPPSVPKSQAQWVIPSTLKSRVHAEQRAHGQFYFLWADLDENQRTITETHRIVQAAIVTDCLVYASRSATQGNQKARLIFPLAQLCSGEQFIVLQKILNDQLLSFGLIPDRATERAAQLCYLPNRGELYDFALTDDAGPLDWRAEFAGAIEAEQRRAQEADAKRAHKMEQARHRAIKRIQTGQASPIDAFNASYPVELLLEQYGYKKNMLNRWLSPNSTSGAAGVVVKENRWISSHVSDAGIGQPCTNGTSGDAFDLFTYYEHGGDSTVALRAAGGMFTDDQGVTITKANQRAHRAAQQSVQQVSQPDDYPEPQPIPDDLLPVMPFDGDLLPEAIRPWIDDISQRMQCPPDFAAVGALVALSGIIGRRACIQPKRFDDWQVIPNLWGCVVGRPGVMKSPALSEVMKPLDRLAIAASEEHAASMRDFEVDSKLSGMDVKAMEKKAQALIAKGKRAEAEKVLRDAAQDEESAPPPLRRFKVNDATVEALGEILIENPNGVLAYRDELSGLLRSLDRPGQEGARAFYLQGYDGDQPYVFDRILRGRNLRVNAVCIAMLGGIQPGRLQSYINDAVKGTGGDDGLLQRFGLLVWPDVTHEWVNVDRWPNTPAKNAAFQIFERLAGMQPVIDPETGNESPRVYKFSPEAQELFEQWRADYEKDLRSSDRHPALASHRAKYRKLVPALALVCSLADSEASVSIKSTARALAWCKYLSSHAERAYAAGIRPSSAAAKALLAKIRAGAVQDSFSPRDVYLKGWSGLDTPEQVHAAAEMLTDLHHLFRDERPSGPTGGRPGLVFKINPRTLRA